MVSAGLLWGGAIAIAWVDASSDTERITRGLHLGFAAVAPPLVAFASFLERRRSGVSGVPTMQGFGWALYSFAIAGEVIGFYNAFHDIPTERWTTLLSGALGTLSVLAHSFDAFLCAREARMQRYRFAASPLGIFVRF